MTEKVQQSGNVSELYTKEIGWRRALHEKYGAYFKTNDKLLELADRMRKKPPGRDVGHMSRATLNYLFGKSRDTYQSIQILCKTAFGRDALILVRSLLENLIIILYMFQDEEKTEERVKEWIQFDLRDRKILLDAIEKEPTDYFGVKDKWVKEKSEIRKSYKQLPERIKKKQGWKYEQLARKVGLEAQYVYYRYLSSLAHPTSTSAKGYMTVEKDRVAIQVGPTSKSIPNALVFSHRYFLMLLNSVNSVFDLSEKQNLAKHERLYSVRKGKLQL
jgi:transcriptional regulator with XRE-family HTH domain